jgi:formiminoglutamate deiminase
MTRSRAQQSRVFWAEYAWLGGAAQPQVNDTGVLAESVAITIEAGRITDIAVDVPDVPVGATPLAGLTLPGLANTHSHAFHRLIRGAEPVHQTNADSFWSWRDQMYEAANGLTPESYGRLAADVFTEMVQAGYTTVGEFHYVHHERDGRPYNDPHAMELAVVEAAQSAGIRMTLLDTCYLRAGFNKKTVDEAQLRFSDGTVEEWEARVEGLARTLRGRSTIRLGGAIHSMRAVSPDDAAMVVRWAGSRQLPLHMHLSEQPMENQQAKRYEHATPTELIMRSGAMQLDAAFCVVHATHLLPSDIKSLGARQTFVSCCPTTERVLADGITPTKALVEAGARLCVGSDSQSIIDPFEELRAVEMHQRLVTGVRGTHSVASLLAAASTNGYNALGWENGGAIAVGYLADFVTVATTGDRLRNAATATLPSAVVLGANGDDVHHVVINGEVVVRDGRSTRRPSALMA